MKALLETAEGFTKTIEVSTLHNRISIARLPKFKAMPVWVTQEGMEATPTVHEVEEMEFELQFRTANFGYYLERN